MSRILLGAARSRRTAGAITVGELIDELGSRSFGWSILFFAFVNMLPMPYGSNMITALPLILLTGQMVAGYDTLHLPGALLRIRIDRRRFQKTVLRLRPLIRPVERLVQPRYTGMFEGRGERLLAVFLLVVSIALFLPIPLSGFFSAFALFVIAFGLIEHDGVVTLIGVALGTASVAVTFVMGTLLVVGARSLAGF